MSTTNQDLLALRNLEMEVIAGSHAVSIPKNTVELVCISYSRPIVGGCEYSVYVQFRLNGKEHALRTASRFDSIELDPHRGLKENNSHKNDLINKTKSTVAQAIITEFENQMNKRLREEKWDIIHEVGSIGTRVEPLESMVPPSYESLPESPQGDGDTFVQKDGPA